MEVNIEKYKKEIVKEFESTLKKYYQDSEYNLEYLYDDYEKYNIDFYSIHDRLFDIVINSDEVIFLEKECSPIDKNKIWEDYLISINDLPDKEKATVDLDKMKKIIFEEREPSMLFKYTFENCKILNYDEIKDEIVKIDDGFCNQIFKYNDKFIGKFEFNEVGKYGMKEKKIIFIMEFDSIDTLRIR